MGRFYNRHMGSIFSPTSFEAIEAFAVSLAIGLLIGLERQRTTDAKAGLRTYALVGLLGCLCGLLAQGADSQWIVVAGLLLVGAMMIAANTVDPHDDGDPGTTSVIAVLICFGLGAMVWFGEATLAVMLAIATTALLYFKSELHGLSAALTPRDLSSILQFGVLSFVILPILPDTDFGPYKALNPHQIWWMVVLISGLSLAGYASLRAVGARHGAALVGLFGGLASSTATTMVFARHARAHEDMARTSALVIQIAALVVLCRLGVVAAVLAPQMLATLAAVFGGGLAAGAIVLALSWRSLMGSGDLPTPQIGNPTELKAALSFGALYAVVLVVSAALQDFAGDGGLYGVALASGLTDVDAITLSTLRLFNTGTLVERTTVVTIVLAVLANIVFKSGLVLSIGGRTLAGRTLPGLAAIAAGMLAMLVAGA